MSGLAGLDLPLMHVQKLESGELEVSSSLVHMAIMCGVRAQWLMMDGGPMLEGGVVSDLPGEGLTPDERRMLRGFRAASPKLQKAFMRFADFVSLAMDPAYEDYISATRSRNAQRDE